MNLRVGTVFNTIYDLDLNPSGRMACLGDPFNIGDSVYTISNKFNPLAVRGGKSADGTMFLVLGSFVSPFLNGISINDAGQVAMRAETIDGKDGIYVGNRVGGMRRVVQTDDNSKDGGVFSGFTSDFSVGVFGGEPLVGFTARTTGSAGDGLYLGTPSAVKLVATGNQNNFRMNNVGQIVFSGFLEVSLCSFGTPGLASAVVSSSTMAPDVTPFDSASNAVINDLGQIAFAGRSNGFSTSGIYLRQPNGTFKTVATEGQAFDGGTLESLGEPEINHAGVVMFRAQIRKGLIDSASIFLGNGDSLIKVVGAGDSVAGSVVIQDFYSPYVATGGRLPEHGSLNRHGQVAYYATLNNGKKGVFMFTPELKWNVAGDGAWDTAANWTLGLLPSALHNVSISPDANLTVTGPSINSQVSSLTVGGGTGVATLRLQSGKVLAVKNGVTVAANGILSGSGSVTGALTLQAGAQVSLKIGGTVKGQSYEFIKTSGNLALDGTLDITFANGFAPAPGDRFDVLDFKSRAGAFNFLKLPALQSSGIQWDASAFAKSGTLAVILKPELPGNYTGLIKATPAEFATSGLIDISLIANGRVKAKGVYGGRKFSVAGPLNQLGEFSDFIYKDGPVLKLTLDLSGAVGQFTGVISEGGNLIASLTADRALIYNPKTSPNPYTGTYTVALPVSSGAAKYPRGTGFGTLAIAANGSAKLIGMLGDATPITFGGKVTTKGEVLAYIALYKKTGHVFGKIMLQGRTANDAVDGTLDWFRPAAALPAFFDEIKSQITIEGSGYQAPSFAAGAAIFTVANGGIPAVAPKTVTIDAKGKMTADPADGLKVKLLAKGLFSGTFTVPATVGKVQSYSFKGAVIQKQNAAKGVFKGIEQTGKVEFVPVP